jgi:hypothetical protein
MSLPSQNDPDDSRDGPATRAELEAALDDVLTAAWLNEVEIDAGLDVRHPETDVPDWSVEIVRLRKHHDS